MTVGHISSFYPRDAILALPLNDVLLTLRLSVTGRYCVYTANTILKLYWPSDSHIIWIFWPLAPIPNSKGNPIDEALNTRVTGWEKLAIFDGNCPSSRKRCEI